MQHYAPEDAIVHSHIDDVESFFFLLSSISTFLIVLHKQHGEQRCSHHGLMLSNLIHVLSPILPLPNFHTVPQSLQE
jgi:hypothetical protein